MAPVVLPIDLGAQVSAAFTGRDLESPTPLVGAAGNLSHRRPHRPDDLAAARAAVAAATTTDASRWHLMHQVHGREVAVVGAETEPGTELGAVDAAVTALPGRPLVVLVADCVPVLFAGERTVGVVHAGRAGVLAGVVDAALDAAQELGEDLSSVTAVIGPAIGGCCYEVPSAMRDEVAAVVPDVATTTTWDTPSLDLPAGVRAQLEGRGVGAVGQVGGCTRCDEEGRWFSHRADPGTGRQAGVIVRHGRAS